MGDDLKPCEHNSLTTCERCALGRAVMDRVDDDARVAHDWPDTAAVAITDAILEHGVSVKNEQTEKWLRRSDNRGTCPCPTCAKWRRDKLYPAVLKAP